MATLPSMQSVYEQTRREHELIREQLKALHQQLQRQPGPTVDIERRFHELRTVLEDHFRSEERDGFFEQIVTRAPQLSRQAESLTREHTQLLAQLDSLVQSAKLGVAQPLAWQTLSLRFDVFMRELMHHEGEENVMLQQAYVDDLGTKD